MTDIFDTCNQFHNDFNYFPISGNYENYIKVIFNIGLKLNEILEIENISEDLKMELEGIFFHFDVNEIGAYLGCDYKKVEEYCKKRLTGIDNILKRDFVGVDLIRDFLNNICDRLEKQSMDDVLKK